jgi:parallel beta-helix repeat protein
MSCSFTEGAPHNGLSGGRERVTYYITCIATEDTRNEVISINGGYFRGASLDTEKLHLNPTGIFITASRVDGTRFRAINIGNPILIGCSTNAGAGNVTGAIDIYNGAENIIIAGATIRYFTYAGIKVQNSSRFSISGNTITDGAVPPGAFSPHAVGITTTEKNRSSKTEQSFGQISGNIVEGCRYAGILNNCDWVAVSANILNRVAPAETGAGLMNDGNNVTIIGNTGTNVGGTFIASAGDHVRMIGNNFDSGTDGRADAILFRGHDIAISDNSLVSGKMSAGSGIRTNGPASHIRIGGNYVENFPYGVDIRTTQGAVGEVVISPNQFAGMGVADYNLARGIANAARVVTQPWQ